MARATMSKVHLYKDDPQLARLPLENANGRPPGRVIREVSNGPPLVQQ